MHRNITRHDVPARPTIPAAGGGRPGKANDRIGDAHPVVTFGVTTTRIAPSPFQATHRNIARIDAVNQGTAGSDPPTRRMPPAAGNNHSRGTGIQTENTRPAPVFEAATAGIVISPLPATHGSIARILATRRNMARHDLPACPTIPAAGGGYSESPNGQINKIDRIVAFAMATAGIVVSPHPAAHGGIACTHASRRTTARHDLPARPSTPATSGDRARGGDGRPGETRLIAASDVAMAGITALRPVDGGMDGPAPAGDARARLLRRPPGGGMIGGA